MMWNQLSAQQQQIVRYDGMRHLLVLAPPGSGKTFTITERIAYHIERRTFDADRILVMTFTNQAAQALRERLEARLGGRIAGAWLGTFHALCDRWLRDEGGCIDITPSFRVFEPPEYRRILMRAIEQTLGGITTSNPNRFVREIEKAIAEGKRQLFRPSAPARTGLVPVRPDHLARIADAYNAALKAAHALDFDDLITNTLRMLRDDEAAARIRRGFTHLFLDEYHDVSPEQYALIRYLTPPSQREHTVMVLADPRQSIYEWRWANASKMLDNYRQDYKPIELRLSCNFRSTGHIIRAAEAIVNKARHNVHADVSRDEGELVYEKWSQDQYAEAAWIARQICQMTTTGRYRYGDIAILYRTHRRADVLEMTLLHAGIPIDRVEEGRFYTDPDVQGTLRYLALIASLHDDHFVPSLNWPRVLIDEITMVDLRRLADRAGLSLAQLAQQIDQWDNDIGPLTRATIRDFLDSMGAHLLAIADQPVGAIVDRLLRLLARRQPPWSGDERTAISGFLRVLGRTLEQRADLLLAAIEARREIALVHDRSLDAIAGCLVFAHVLEHFWRIRPTIVDTTPVGDEVFAIVCGSAMDVSPNGFGLARRDALTTHYSISTQAWRIGQILLLRCERGRDQDYVVYDIEATGVQHTIAEMLEIAAMRIRNGNRLGPRFTSLVKPCHPIPSRSTEIHGIRDCDVAAASSPADVIPAFLDYVAEATYVGHNIQNFDHPLLRRVAQEHGLPAPSSYIVDTCELARRLLPHQSHRLQDLAAHWAIRPRQAHRANGDVETTAHVFEQLLDLIDDEKTLDALNDVLPLVAIGIVGAGCAVDGENEVLIRAGAQTRSNERAQALLHRMADLVPDRTSFELAYNRVEGQPIQPSDDERRWQRLSEQWHTQMERYRATGGDQSLPAFLRHAALAQSLDHETNPDGRVSMMTIHSSKGLEWSFVFIVGAENDQFPLGKPSTAEIDEERRIMYVGITRAMERLCMTWVAPSGAVNSHSHFLDDIPHQHIRSPRHTG